MTANIPGFYGSDHNDRRFKLVPGTVESGSDWRGGAYGDEKYFTMVNEKTGEVEIWENDSSGFSMHDKRVGNIGNEYGT